MTRERLEVAADSYFAIIPEWVLYADVSSNAIRLYGVLRRHADKSDGTCHPTRTRLAGLCRFSKATVDRALEELVSIGAVKVINRRSKAGDWTSNLYVVLSTAPREVSSPVMTPLLTGDDTGVLTGDEQTIVSNNQSQERRVSTKSSAGEDIARGWWEQQDPKPAGKRAWFALVNACQAVSDRGWEPDQIRRALDKIGAVPSVAQLDRELRNPRAETWSEKKAREEREERDRSEARQRAREAEAEEHRRHLAELEAQAVPMPDHVRERIKALQGRGPA